MRLFRFFRLTNAKRIEALEAENRSLKAELEEEKATIVTIVSADPRLETSVINFLSTEVEDLRDQLASRP